MTSTTQPGEVLKDVTLWLRMYRNMVAIRLFETQVNELYTRALMPGLAHLYIGEEAVAVGVCEALERSDYITSTHRGHGHCLAKGASPNRMFAELLGKKAGYCKGKGGSMHIADPATGNLGANAIVCGSAGIATGAAFSAKHLGTKRVAVCFFGEGALGQGVLYEVMNLAELFKLPVIYVCENNLYNEYTHYSETTAGDILYARHGVWTARLPLTGRTCVRFTRLPSILMERARSGRWPRLSALQYLPLSRASCRRHQPRVLPLEKGRAELEERARSHPELRQMAHGPESRGQDKARCD